MPRKEVGKYHGCTCKNTIKGIAFLLYLVGITITLLSLFDLFVVKVTRMYNEEKFTKSRKSSRRRQREIQREKQELLDTELDIEMMGEEEEHDDYNNPSDLSAFQRRILHRKYPNLFDSKYFATAHLPLMSSYFDFSGNLIIPPLDIDDFRPFLTDLFRIQSCGDKQSQSLKKEHDQIKVNFLSYSNDSIVHSLLPQLLPQPYFVVNDISHLTIDQLSKLATHNSSDAATNGSSNDISMAEVFNDGSTTCDVVNDTHDNDNDNQPSLIDGPIVLAIRHPLPIIFEQSFSTLSSINDLDFVAMESLHSSAQHWRDFIQLSLQQLSSESDDKQFVIIEFESLINGGILQRIDEWWKALQSLVDTHRLQRLKSELMHSFLCTDVSLSIVSDNSSVATYDTTLSKWESLLKGIDSEDICQIWELLYTYANVFGYAPIHFECQSIFDV